MALPERIISVTLEAAETEIKFSVGWEAFAVRNDGSSPVYIAAESGKSAGDADVLLIPAGESAVYYRGVKSDSCFISGEAGGAVTVIGQRGDKNPFKSSGKGGEHVFYDNGMAEYSGMSGAVENTVDAPCYVTDFPVNLLEITADSNSIYHGVSFTADRSSGTILVNGTSIDVPENYYHVSNIALEPGDYFFRGHQLLSSMDNYGDVERAHIYLAVKPVGGGNSDIVWQRDLDGQGVAFTVSTLSSATCYIYFSSNVIFDNTLFKPVVTKGNKYRGFIPYSGGTVKTCGKNLIDPETSVPGGVVAGNGTVEENMTGFKSTDFIKIYPEKRYVSNAVIHGHSHVYGYAFYDYEKNYISGNSYGTVADIITPPDNAAYIRMSIIITNIQPTLYEDIYNADIYEPYHGTELFISPGTPLPIAGLKTFDGVTNVISDFDVTLKYYQKGEPAVPAAALENQIMNLISEIAALKERVIELEVNSNE